MWLSARLAYWMSFCRPITCQIDSGSSRRLPDVGGEDERVAPRVVVENHLERRVGVEAAVPVRLAVDAHRRKPGRQRAGGHHVVDAERHVAAVEVAHLPL